MGGMALHTPIKAKNAGNRGENVIFSFGPKAIQMERKLKRCDAHGQLHTKLGPAETQHGEHCVNRSVFDSQRLWKILVKNGHFEDFGLGWPCPAIWTSTWPQVPRFLLTKAGPSSKRRQMLGQSANHSPVHCLASCPGRTCTPQLKLHQ